MPLLAPTKLACSILWVWRYQTTCHIPFFRQLSVGIANPRPILEDTKRAVFLSIWLHCLTTRGVGNDLQKNLSRFRSRLIEYNSFQHKGGFAESIESDKKDSISWYWLPSSSQPWLSVIQLKMFPFWNHIFLLRLSLLWLRNCGK